MPFQLIVCTMYRNFLGNLKLKWLSLTFISFHIPRYIDKRVLICIAPYYIIIYEHIDFTVKGMILNPFQHHFKISFNICRYLMKTIWTYGNKNCQEQRIFLPFLWPQCLCLVPETFSLNFDQILQFCKQTIPERKKIN